MTGQHFIKTCPNCERSTQCRCPSPDKLVYRDFCSAACRDAFMRRNPKITDFGFAPGEYSCKCSNCRALFGGEKRCTTCAVCALLAAADAADRRVDAVRVDGTKFVKQFEKDEWVVSTAVIKDILFVATNKRVYRLVDGVLHPLVVGKEQVA